MLIFYILLVVVQVKMYRLGIPASWVVQFCLTSIWGLSMFVNYIEYKGGNRSV